MEISAISSTNSEINNHRRNSFIQFSNSFMSMPKNINPIEKALGVNMNSKKAKMGLENLEEFTIFPKEIVNGKSTIIA